MDSTNESSSSLREELQAWGVVLAESPNLELQALLVWRYSHWKFHARFMDCLPASTHELTNGLQSFGYVWDARRIVECLVEEDPLNNRFLPVLSLNDGSFVCVDTISSSAMQLASFPFELCSGWMDWNFDVEAMVTFPFQYPDYLRYLRATPHPKFLDGYGGGF